MRGPDGRPGDLDAGRYDAWYDTDAGAAILTTEIAALRPLVEAFPKPRLEVGVGTGRFARALEARCGLDPSGEALQLARRRGVLPAAGVGEATPLRHRDLRDCAHRLHPLLPPRPRTHSG